MSTKVRIPQGAPAAYASSSNRPPAAAGLNFDASTFDQIVGWGSESFRFDSASSVVSSLAIPPLALAVVPSLFVLLIWRSLKRRRAAVAPNVNDADGTITSFFKLIGRAIFLLFYIQWTIWTAPYHLLKVVWKWPLRALQATAVLVASLFCYEAISYWSETFAAYQIKMAPL